MIKGLRLPMTNKERASKRALRRNASDRAGNTTPTKSATGRNPRNGSTRNKYSLLEQQDREERRNLEIHKDMFQGTDGPRSLGMSAATLEAQNRARSGSAGKIERAKLRMTRVDGFNSTVGSNLPKRGTVSNGISVACLPCPWPFPRLRKLLHRQVGFLRMQHGRRHNSSLYRASIIAV